MFMIPGFDPKTMTDDQLLERSQELVRRINFAGALGGNNGYETLLLMSQLIDNERRERMFLDSWKTNKTALSATIETDPDLREIEKPKSEENNSKSKTRFGTVKRSNAPVATPYPVIPDKPTSGTPT